MITNWYHERSVRNKMVYLKTIGKNTEEVSGKKCEMTAKVLGWATKSS